MCIYMYTYMYIYIYIYYTYIYILCTNKYIYVIVNTSVPQNSPFFNIPRSEYGEFWGKQSVLQGPTPT